MSKKTIGIVLNNTPGYSETFFYNKINSLIAQGCRVILFSKMENKVPAHWKVVTPFAVPENKKLRSLLLVPVLLQLAIKAPGRVKKFVKLERSTGNSWKKVAENLYINAHILAYKADWLHFGFATTALRRENVAKAIGAKMGVSFRGYDISVYPLKYDGCYNLLWKRVDKAHAISNYLLHSAHNLGLDSGKPSAIITPAIDYKRFYRERQAMNTGTVHIFTTARLTWVKGIAYALQAMKMLKDAGVDFKYTIAGAGSEKDSLTFMAYELGLADNVVLAGKVDSKQVEAYLQSSTIYLQTSVDEGFCNAVLEAQAAGLLCIVSDAGGLNENVKDGETGWVVPKRNPRALADKIIEVINLDDAAKQQVIRSAQQRVQDEFTLEEQTKQFIEFYA